MKCSPESFLPAHRQVGEVSAVARRTVEINGPVRLDGGRPEIVISARSQIKLR
jgi:hypothetical protein